MKDTELYKKIYIKDVSDLPKEAGYYYASTKEFKPRENQMWNRCYEKGHNDNWWLTEVDWYLQPLQSEGQPKHSIKGKMKEIKDGGVFYIGESEEQPKENPNSHYCKLDRFSLTCAIFEDSYDGCRSCEYFKSQPKEKILKSFAEKMSNQKDIDPEIAQHLTPEFFNELLKSESQPKAEAKGAEEFILHKLDERNEKRHGTWKWKDIAKLDPHLPSFGEIASWLEEYATQPLPSDITDEEIEKWADEMEDELFERNHSIEECRMIVRSRVFGAKAMRDRKIKSK